MGVVKRPWGVSLLAVLCFVAVVTYTTLAILSFASPETLRSILVGLSPQGSGPEVLLNLGSALGIYFAVMALFAGLLGYGTWTLRNWARWITIVIVAISLVGTAIGLIAVLGDINLSTALLGLFRLGLSVLVLWYFLSPKVRAAFRSRSM